MKRRSADCSKLRRPLKRNRITEGIYGSTFLYLKFLVVWALVLLADFVLEFRFEYLWPFWLFIRSVYDSFRYQGLAFSVFFVCVAFTSNIICLLFIPIQWLFFAASTYVWVQYVWHTERGVCLPTVSLWILFVYIEAAIRFKDLKNFHVDLCRPFAAHCIGYPVVTLGFGFKSYVSYKMRLRKQKEVQKENEFYMQLLQQALPPEQQMLQRQEREAEEAAKGLSDMDSSMLLQHNGGIPANKKISATLPELEYREKGKEKDKDAKKHNLGINNNILQPVDSKIQEIEYMENHINSKRLNNDLVGSTENLLKEDSCTASSKNYKNVSGVVNSSPRSHSATNGSIPSSSSKNEKKQKCASKSPSTHKDLMENCIPNNQLSKPDALVRVFLSISSSLKEFIFPGGLGRQEGAEAGVVGGVPAHPRSFRGCSWLFIHPLIFSIPWICTDSLPLWIQWHRMFSLLISQCLLAQTPEHFPLLFTGQILQKDQEIKELKQKIAEVMAVMPSITYTAATSTLSPVSPHYSSKFVEPNPSGLDPNASVYQPLKK
ncbi:macoilin [Parus major]|uniref:macoilin n=1 Tax=Parus major TaxID=9157 RepID=UPI00144450C8|nr:macoilin [Parus major]